MNVIFIRILGESEWKREIKVRVVINVVDEVKGVYSNIR